MSCKFAFVFLFLFAGATSWADETTFCGTNDCQITGRIVHNPVPESLNKAFQEFIISGLRITMTLGFEKLGALSLHQLSEEVSTVKFIQVDRGFLSPQGRASGFMYRVEERSVYYERDVLNSISGTNFKMAAILLHETLGALGYVDDDYQLSSVLSALKHLKPREAQRILQSKVLNDFPVERRTQSPSGLLRSELSENEKMFLAAGGSTTVGGGGDLLMATVKMWVVLRALKLGFSADQLRRLAYCIRMERVTMTEFLKYGFPLILKSEYSRKEFSQRILMSRSEEKVVLLIGVLDFTPAAAIDEHIFDYIVKNRLLEEPSEKK